ATVTFTLTLNDNGVGTRTLGKWALYADVSTGDNAGLCGFGVALLNYSAPSARTPLGNYTSPSKTDSNGELLEPQPTGWDTSRVPTSDGYLLTPSDYALYPPATTFDTSTTGTLNTKANVLLPGFIDGYSIPDQTIYTSATILTVTKNLVPEPASLATLLLAAP